MSLSSTHTVTTTATATTTTRPPWVIVSSKSSSQPMPNGRKRFPYSQIPPNDENSLTVITYAVGHIHSIKDVVIVGHMQCGGAKEVIAAITSKDLLQVEPVLVKWLSGLIELAERLISDPPPPDFLNMLIKASVRVQVNNVAKSEIHLG
ncbi:hypothetical protein EI94DRAFT_1820998 [Lactarius quietus]|nr:hypothetical protein EI94DRAFT_1820998 [Lactarius quietus]